MKSRFNYQVLLSRIARNQYKLHDLKQEWRIFILFVFMAKILTWSISIFAGTSYFTMLLLPVLQQKTFTTTMAVAVLIIIEVLTTIALSKFFKFFYRGTNHISTTIALAFVVVGLFGISFISSTNGLAMRQAKKADNTDIIVEKSALKKKETKNDFKNRLFEINSQIGIIKNNPQGWTKGVRSTLLAWQLAKIDSLQKQKTELRNNEMAKISMIDQAVSNEIIINNKNTTAEADKYYRIISVVMIVQFIASGMLMFFWKRILNEDDEKLVISEDIKELKDVMFTNAFMAAKNHMSEVSNMIASQLIIANEQYEPDFSVEEKNDTQIIGFGNQSQNQKQPVKKQPKQAISKPDVQPSRLDTSAIFIDAKKPSLKQVEYLTKHRPLVRAIKLLKIPERDSIHNKEIIMIQEAAKNAKQKGRTTIQNVYRVAVTVGLNKIDKNGKIIIS